MQVPSGPHIPGVTKVASRPPVLARVSEFSVDCSAPFPYNRLQCAGVAFRARVLTPDLPVIKGRRSPGSR
jgi:hypothetical protein